MGNYISELKYAKFTGTQSKLGLLARPQILDKGESDWSVHSILVKIILNSNKHSRRRKGGKKERERERERERESERKKEINR